MSLFPILLHVEEIAVGRVLRLLHATEGVADIQPIWDEIPKPRGRINGKAKATSGTASKKHKSDDGPRAIDIIITELIKGPQQGDHLKQILNKHGFAGDGAYVLLKNLQERNIVTKVDKGLYRLSDEAAAKLNEHPPQPTPTSLPAPEPVKRSGQSGHLRKGEGQKFVAKFIRENGGRADRQQIVDAAAVVGMDQRAVENTLYRLRNLKQVKSPEKGIWELTAKGNKDFPPEEAGVAANQEGQ